jgi:hypothetical protein
MAKGNGGSTIPGFSFALSGAEVARMLKCERTLPEVELHVIDADRAQLFVGGWPATSGPLETATAIMRQLGFKPGDEYKMITATGEQAIVRVRSKSEREAGVSAIARRLPKGEAS